MKNLKLLKNNDNRDWEDLEWVNELHQFLQGKVPETIKLGKGNKPKMTSKQAFSVVWYLQEHFPLIPDSIEQCGNCGSLYDSDSSGTYCENDPTNKHFYCGGCIHLAPEDEDDE